MKNNDIYFNEGIHKKILEYMKNHNIVSLAMPYQIVDCPHEEGIDYPREGNCSECPYWKNRER